MAAMVLNQNPRAEESGSEMHPLSPLLMSKSQDGERADHGPGGVWLLFVLSP